MTIPPTQNLQVLNPLKQEVEEDKKLERKASLISYDTLEPYPSLHRVMSGSELSGIKKLKESLSYFSQMPSKILFSEKRAEDEVSNALKSHFAQTLKIVLDIGKQCAEKHPKRMHKFLCLCFLRSKNVHFMNRYFERSNEDSDLFAKDVVQIYAKEKSMEIVSLLSRYTSYDLKKQKRETLFRESCFSSSLCREYGTFLLQNELKILSTVILANLENFSYLCLDRQRIKERLEHRIASLEPDMQNKKIDQELKVQFEEFKSFANFSLERLYTMNFSSISALLTRRRTSIERFLGKNQDGKDPYTLSRSYIGELLFLRILNPYLLNSTQSAEKLSILKRLAKVIQFLSNETHDSEKKDEEYDFLHPLFEKFLPFHCKFVDTLSMTQKRKEK